MDGCIGVLDQPRQQAINIVSACAFGIPGQNRNRRGGCHFAQVHSTHAIGYRETGTHAIGLMPR